VGAEEEEIVRFLPGLVRRETSEEEEEEEVVAAREGGEVSGTRVGEPTGETAALIEAEAEVVVADGIEETVMEVVVEAGEETTEAREPLCPPTTGGKTSPRTDTMEEAVEVAEVETIGGVAVVEEVEVSGTVMTGPNLCLGMRGRRRNSSTPATVRLASTLTGTRTFL